MGLPGASSTRVREPALRTAPRPLPTATPGAPPLVRGRVTGPEWVGYAAAQVVAAALAGLGVRWVGGKETAAPVASSGKMLVAEFVFTFAVAWVVLHVATARGPLGNSFCGL